MEKPMQRWILRVTWPLIAVLLLFGSAMAADTTWPREITTEKGVLTIYQPQPEKLEGNVLTGRAAISLTPQGQSAPVFGVFWFSCRVDANQDNGEATLRDIAVTQARWPESTAEKEKEFA